MPEVTRGGVPGSGGLNVRPPSPHCPHLGTRGPVGTSCHQWGWMQGRGDRSHTCSSSGEVQSLGSGLQFLPPAWCVCSVALALASRRVGVGVDCPEPHRRLLFDGSRSKHVLSLRSGRSLWLSLPRMLTANM